MTMHPKPKNPRKISTKVNEAIRQFPYYLRAMRLIWGAAPRLTLVWAILLIIQGLLPAASVYLAKLLVDSLVKALGIGFSWASIQPLVIQASLMAFILLLTEVLQSILEWVRTAQSEYIQDYITDLIHVKSAEVDLEFYESPEYYDHLQRAQSDASARSLALLESTGSLFQNAITLLAMAAILIPYGAWLPLMLFFGTIPALYIVFHYNYRYHQWWKNTTTDRRWTQYFNLLLTTNFVAAELRLFDLGHHFQSAYREVRQKLRSERLILLKDQNLARLAAGGLALLATGIAVVWVVWQAVLGMFTLGDLALFYQAYTRGQNLMRALFGNIGQIYTNSLFLNELFQFLELKPKITVSEKPQSLPQILKESICFKKVTFGYPGSQNQVLKDFDLTFEAGKITAIVGENGSGKSTLVKLLCRLYDPDGGCIEFDGVDVRDAPIEQLRRMITVLFQLPATYYKTASQNIAIGDLTAKPTIEDVEEAARGAGAHEIISRLPKGYDTLLGKLFAGGNELSVGEWQRVALARAFLREAQIIILDEPTSFMDSWAEADWMERFHSLVAGRTAIVITHRFTTARHADIIHVMKEGNVVESGSHAELLVQGGMYAKSWEAQFQDESLSLCESYTSSLTFQT